MQKFRPVIQVLFLGLFLLLMVKGKAQLWMAFIFLSIVLSSYFGRFYCGWACPINTLIRPVAAISKRLGLQKKGISSMLKSGKPRIVVFILFLAGLGYTIYTISQGRKFPLPLIIIPLGLITTLFINELAWHRYLCPWGVLFSLTGRFAKVGMQVEGCNSCSACIKVCPGGAVTVAKKQPAVVDSTHCLLCFECQKSCTSNALNYRKLSEKSHENVAFVPQAAEKNGGAR